MLKRRISSGRGAEHSLHNLSAGPSEPIVIEKITLMVLLARKDNRPGWRDPEGYDRTNDWIPIPDPGR